MDATIHDLDTIAEDHPIPLIHRKTVAGERVLLARVRLDKGCHVALHQHESEQIAYVVSGRVRWTLGAEGTPERRQVETGAGEVVVLPSLFPHGVDALEDTLIIDLLSPPGAMGIDNQRD